MDPIFLLTGLGSVIGALAGLFLVCHVERRTLTRRRGTPARASGRPAAEGEPAALTSE